MRTITQHTGMWPIFSNAKCALENLVISVGWDNLSRGTFCPQDLMSGDLMSLGRHVGRFFPGTLCPWNVLSRATYRNCPVRRFVPWDLMSGDLMSLGCFVQWDVLSSGTFCLGTFCLCTVCTSSRYRYQYLAGSGESH